MPAFSGQTRQYGQRVDLNTGWYQTAASVISNKSQTPVISKKSS
jgi:hypothetical protein